MGQARSGPHCSGAAGRMPERGCAAAGRSCAVCWCCPCCRWGSARPASRSGPWPSAERDTSTRRSRVMRPRCGAGCVYVSLYIVLSLFRLCANASLITSATSQLCATCALHANLFQELQMLLTAYIKLGRDLVQTSV